MLLKRARRAILPATAAVAWSAAIAMAAADRVSLDDGDRLALAVAIVTSMSAITWAIAEHFYRKLTRDRQDAHAGHDLVTLAEGVAAYMRQNGGTAGTGDSQPGKRA